MFEALDFVFDTLVLVKSVLGANKSTQPHIEDLVLPWIICYSIAYPA